MILNYRTSSEGRRYRVLDANGLEWTHVVECDTETGRIERYRTTAEGRFFLDVETRLLARETVYAAPPLLVVEVKPT